MQKHIGISSFCLGGIDATWNAREIFAKSIFIMGILMEEIKVRL